MSRLPVNVPLPTACIIFDVPRSGAAHDRHLGRAKDDDPGDKGSVVVNYCKRAEISSRAAVIAECQPSSLPNELH